MFSSYSKYLLLTSCLLAIFSCATTYQMPKDPLLITAVRDWPIEKITELLNKGENIEIQDYEGNTPLMIASKNGSLNIVRLLVEKGANIKARNNEGVDSLILLSNERIFGSPMSTSGTQTLGYLGITTQGHLQVAEYLLDKGVDPNTEHEQSGTTALIVSTTLNKEVLVDLLLRKGADINRPNKGGTTALMFAVSNNNAKIVKLLIDKGADINAKNQSGKSAIDYATTEQVRGLLSRER